MINKITKSQGNYNNRFVPLELRFSKIMEVLSKTEGPLSSVDICNKYLENPDSSDPLSTNHILNVLSLAGLVKKHVSYKGKSIRVEYELNRNSNDT